MSIKKVLQLSCLSAPALVLAIDPSYGMLRVLKYRPLTEVQDQQICVYAKHEKNQNPENQLHPQNSKAPIVCRLTILGEAWPQRASVALAKTLSVSVVTKFEFDTLTKACASFAEKLPEGFKLKDFAGMNTECTTAEAATRVFPDFKG